MKRSSFLSCTTAAVAIAAVAACSDSTTAPGGQSSTFESQASGDLAPSAGRDVGMDYAFYSMASGTGVGVTFSQNVPTGASGVRAIESQGVATSWLSPLCTYRPSLHDFGCPLLSLLGHSMTVSYQFFDATGAVQSSYNKTTTGSATLTVSDTGAIAFSWNNNSYADTSSHHRTVTLSNLLGNPDTLHIWNGTGSTAEHSVRVGQISKTYQLVSSDTTTNVAIRQPRGLNPYPLSGTIVRNYDVTRTRAASDTTTHHTTRRVMVTFNGTANVPMTVGSDSYLLNLDTYQVTKQ